MEHTHNNNDRQFSSHSEDSDDDWFNKSLDEFDVPVKDAWDEEEEEEEEEEAVSERSKTPHGTNRKLSAASTSPSSSPDRATKKKTSPAAKKQKQKGKAGQSRSAIAPRLSGRAEGRKCNRDDGGPTEIYSDVGLTIKLSPSSGQQPQLIFEDRGQVECSWEGETREGEGVQKGEVREREGVQEGEVREGEEVQEGEVTYNKEEALSTEGDDDDDGGRGEDWFQTRLQELPTVLRLTRAFTLSMARIKQVQTWATYPTIKLVDDDDDDNVEDENQAAATASDVYVKLQLRDDGDLSHVKKMVKRRMHAGDLDTDLDWTTVRRSHFPSNFKVVMSWLRECKEETETRRKPDAEVEAYGVARRYPFSSVAVANLCHILWMKGKRQQARDALTPLLLVRARRPQLFQQILQEDLGEMGRLLTQLSPHFVPAAMECFQSVLLTKPHWHLHRFLLALSLRRMARLQHLWTKDTGDLGSLLLQSLRLLLDVRQAAQEDESLWVLSQAAVGELADVLGECRFHEDLETTVGREARARGLTAEVCFNLIKETENPWGPNLWRAGKYFRYGGQLMESRRVLKRAAAWDKSRDVHRVLHLHDVSKDHHHFALTLKKLALKERRESWQRTRRAPASWAAPQRRLGTRRGESKQDRGVIFPGRRHACDDDPVLSQFERTVKSPVYQQLGRGEPHVREAMEHFHRALTLCDGENCEVSYDLGLMYKSLSEYTDALQQFLDIVQLDSDPSLSVRALEQAGLVYLERCSLDEGSAELEEKGKALLLMMILVQCRIARDMRAVQGFHSHHAWRSMHSLGRFMRLDNGGMTVGEEETESELWLLRLLRVYADTVPVLTSLQQYTPGDVSRDASHADKLRDKLHKYVARDKSYEDALLFASLLQLTEHRHVVTGTSTHLLTKAHVLAARARLETSVKKGSVEEMLNADLAQRLFRWTFEDRRPAPATADEATPACVERQSAVPEASLTAGKPDDTQAASQGFDQRGGSQTIPRQSHKASLTAGKPDDTQAASQGFDQRGGSQTIPRQSHKASLTAGKPDEPQAVSQGLDHRRGSPGGNDPHSLAAPEQDKNAPEALAGIHDSQGDNFVYHVILVHEPRDAEVAAEARLLQTMVEKRLGLRCHVTNPALRDSTPKDTLATLRRARLLLFVIGRQGFSPITQRYVDEATQGAFNTQSAEDLSPGVTHRNVLTLTLDSDVTLPRVLQKQPSFPWKSKAASSARGAPGEVQAVCELFCFLIDFKL